MGLAWKASRRDHRLAAVYRVSGTQTRSNVARFYPARTPRNSRFPTQ